MRGGITGYMVFIIVDKTNFRQGSMKFSCWNSVLSTKIYMMGSIFESLDRTM